MLPCSAAAMLRASPRAGFVDASRRSEMTDLMVEVPPGDPPVAAAAAGGSRARPRMAQACALRRGLLPAAAARLERDQPRRCVLAVVDLGEPGHRVLLGRLTVRHRQTEQ